MYIDAIPPGSTVKQVLEVKIQRCGFSTDPGEQPEHDLEQRDSGHGQSRCSTQKADFLDGHLQRKMGLGWSSEAVDVNIPGLWESSTKRYLTRTVFFFKGITVTSNYAMRRGRIRD